MLHWLADHAGTICVVLGGIAVTVGTIGASILASTPIGLAITIGVFAIGSALSGLFCLGREYGRRAERERQQAKIESERAQQLELERLNTAENILSSNNGLLLEQTVNETRENHQYLTMQASINTLERRVSFLEGAQSTRFKSESLREIHNERILNAAQVDCGSDSDSEDANLLSRQSMFPPNNPKNVRNRRPAANDSLDLGVELRYRNSTHK
ncbi:MAG: hypothetical protein Q8R24_10150 [Legionellaceae bacterium]|nr:hypothetical protein [Legionellaceae bacterium]